MFYLTPWVNFVEPLLTILPQKSLNCPLPPEIFHTQLWDLISIFELLYEG